MSIIIDNVINDSIAAELGLQKGDEVLSINKQIPKDIIEYSYLINEEIIELLVKKTNGELVEFEIEKEYYEDLGIIFTSAVFDSIKKCQNHCIFCFVDQQPKGLRKSLYVKDDDWRLSYIQGTYITLTNLSEADFKRIEKYHISPLFISIHTTNPKLREKMTRNPKAGLILDYLERFKKNKISFHGQIVLCPNYNDGLELKRTLDDLKKFKSVLKSVAIVPVGISKFRKEEFARVDKKIALETIKLVNEFNLSIKKQIAMVSDEFFLIANEKIPAKNYYGDFLQIEDGVGAIRLLIDSFNKEKKKLKKKIKEKTTLSIATAKSAAKIFKEFQKEIKVENLNFEVIEVKNRFFGSDINVAGLITGSDIIDTIKDKKIENLIIPSVMLKKTADNYEEVFLDGKTVDDIRNLNKNSKVFIIKDCYSFCEILNIINNL